MSNKSLFLLGSRFEQDLQPETTPPLGRSDRLRVDLKGHLDRRPEQLLRHLDILAIGLQQSGEGSPVKEHSIPAFAYTHSR